MRPISPITVCFSTKHVVRFDDGCHSAVVPLLPDVLPAGPIELRRWRPTFVDAYLPAIALSLAELQQWMDWAQVMPTVEELRSVLETGEAAFDADQEWDDTVYEPATDALVGGAGLHRGGEPVALNIGYWTRSDRTGRGYATAVAKTLTEVAFALIPGIQRVEVHMDKANVASAAVPRKLGYRLDHEEVRQVEAPGHTGHGFVWVLDRPSAPAFPEGARYHPDPDGRRSRLPEPSHSEGDGPTADLTHPLSLGAWAQVVIATSPDLEVSDGNPRTEAPL